jgi:hypothetical protein
MSHVAVQQPFVRFLRIGGKPIASDPVPIDFTAAFTCIVSVGPVVQASWATFRVDNGNAETPPDDTDSANATQSFTVPANTLNTTYEYVIRVARAPELQFGGAETICEVIVTHKAAHRGRGEARKPQKG